MKRHRPDLLSLGFGLLFLFVGLAATIDVLDLRLLEGDWIWATILIGAGVAVLLTLGGRDEPDAVLLGEEDPAMTAARAEVERADVTTPRDAAEELGLDAD
jgi:hypothetical protein